MLGSRVRSCYEMIKTATFLQNNRHGKETRWNLFSRISSSIPEVPHRGLENVTVADVLMTKEEDKTGSWLWCRTDDTVYDAVKNVIMLLSVGIVV